ncbi:pentatricopeptide repeat-containing protein At1g43980, mitochondrial-like [Phoenix dactylifera]|uniref:Pentatricopeptide repeat-containing protein At1g43980, mitochondrial-like n=1 Tax=Phoenix dactylifera TaxID=42345 RepID=A0A8B8JCH7_PHODC|nr:pentatricopeptide repeat-containing protein At1g43980, mitochondrial-like [Phoenix dactylifera]XP_026666244.2 pentatricopeptide repeat-containing protein At1g43980, mitochondrial-like [Phoenix dactylifera]XP_026666245.2 pentatricopeptide repeat-containing protein At1g43980, mitochondrial-like [Phoenix dactylifera]
MIISPPNLGPFKKFDISSFSILIGHCLSLNSLPSAQTLHSNLIKTGLHRHTFLANRLLDLYSRLGSTTSALRVFDEIPSKNAFSFNILLALLSKTGRIHEARQLFEEMPLRDTVSWNSIISGYISNGLFDEASELLYEMQELGARFSEYTLSLAASCVSDARHAKQVHGFLIRSGSNSSNTVVGNALIDMYGRVGVVGYACGVFRAMEDLDVISWNSMISVYGNSGHGEKALECFRSMRAHGFPIDEFTVSSVIHVCADLGHLAKGEQLLAQCFKMGFLSNSVVSSAVIDLYSMCGRLDNSIRLFQEMDRWDSALFNSMASTYARSGLVHEALRLFVLALRKEIRPTGFTFASILRSSSCFGLTEQGTQIHCLVFKLGFEADLIVSSALADMYTKLGSTESAMKIFSAMATKDLVFWNTMIMGFAQNGQGTEALRIFKEMQESGNKPDRITLVGVLSACSHEGMVHEGKRVFSSMEKRYRVVRGLEHYNCMVDMMGRAGRLREAMEIIETMPRKPIAATWELLLEACRIHRNVRLEEIVAEKVMELKPRSSLPYFVLGRMYGTRGRWDSMARVWKTMRERGVKKVSGCSWICIRNLVFVFKSDQILHYGGEETYLVLRLLCWEMEGEGYVPEQHAEFEDQEE